MIAKTLHEAADKHHVDELLVGAGPILGLSQFEGLLVQFVELVVVDDDLLSGLGVAVRQHGHGLVGDVVQERLHFGEQRLGFGRQRGSRVGAAGGFGDVTSQIAHTFESGGQTHGGNNHAKIGGNRVLLGQQLHALVDNAGFEGIDFDVAVDNGLGGFKILVQQRVAGTVDRPANAFDHVVEIIGNGLELFVENNAHVTCLSMLHNFRSGNTFHKFIRETPYS